MQDVMIAIWVVRYFAVMSLLLMLIGESAFILGASGNLSSYRLLLSYSIRCAAPSTGSDYKKIYSDWCHEFEKYKSAMKLWEKRQTVSNNNWIVVVFYIFFTNIHTYSKEWVRIHKNVLSLPIKFYDFSPHFFITQQCSNSTQQMNANNNEIPRN